MVWIGKNYYNLKHGIQSEVLSKDYYKFILNIQIFDTMRFTTYQLKGKTTCNIPYRKKSAI
jgi:hypothetical protein